MTSHRQPVELARLLEHERPPGAAIALRGEQLLTWAELRRDVEALAAQIGPGRGRWLVALEGSYTLAVALLAVWRTGGVAVLPPNALPGTLAAHAPAARGIIADAAALAALKDLARADAVADEVVDADTSTGIATAATSALAVVVARSGSGLQTAALTGSTPSEGAALELLTSGTTGAPKLVPKALSQLDAEIAALEALFGERLGAAPVLGSVSHQHIYGLLFRVLWPLAAGRAFADEAQVYPEELVRTAARLGGAALVSCPAHLSRAAALVMPALARWCPLVFSSGGPLGAATADAFAAAGGEAPVEVLGSTETGGVAWRRQPRGDHPARLAWTPLPGVRVRLEAPSMRLHVQSPFATPPPISPPTQPLPQLQPPPRPQPPTSAMSADARWVALGDLAELLPDGRLLLRGRGDRIAKVGEKRLSLAAMEARLAGHPFVARAAVAVLPGPPRSRAGAVLVLTPRGRMALETGGRRALAAILRAHLATTFEAVLLPRVFRFVEALPEDAQGKLPAAAIRAVLEAPAEPVQPEQAASAADAATPASGAGAAASGLPAPRVVAERLCADACELDIALPGRLAIFDGHFPDLPIAPGVLQLAWVLQAARMLLGAEPRVLRLEAVKFKRVTPPGARLTVRVERRVERSGGGEGDDGDDGPRAADRLAYRIAGPAGEHASGRIILRPTTPPLGEAASWSAPAC